MRWADKLLLRLRSVFRRRRVDHELDDELRFHLEHQIDENLAAGMTPEEARYAARRSMPFGKNWALSHHVQTVFRPARLRPADTIMVVARVVQLRAWDGHVRPSCFCAAPRWSCQETYP